MNMYYKSLLFAAVASLTACGDDGDRGPAGPGGVEGSDGTNGLNSLVVTSNLAAGDTNCSGGGAKLESGLDANGNGTLDTDEISATTYTCLPAATVDVFENTGSNSWYKAGEKDLQDTQPYESNIPFIPIGKGKAKNVILFVGDGMGISTVTAARILDGQKQGLQGEENILSFGQFPFAGLAKTYNVDAQTPDSAGTMTAMMSGVKTDVGSIGVDEDITRGTCASVAGNELVTALELAEVAGKSTGIISTARITHATPAATYAKSADRNWEDISDMKITDNPERADCEDIASQLVNFEKNLEARYTDLDVDGLEVALGGGRRHFLPNKTEFNIEKPVSAGAEGDRTDDRDLITEWKTTYADGEYVNNKTEFDAIDPEKTTHLFGLFNESHMQYEADRENDIAGEPSIRDMTLKAIEILDNNSEGFFLMVEAGRIDHAHHAGNAHGALVDTIAFADAVAAAAAATNSEDTLIIVTADHSHVFTIAGYPKRGNPILGKVVGVGSSEPSLASDGMPYTTLGYTNGKGFADLGDQTNADAVYSRPNNNGRKDLKFVDTQTPGFHQESLVPTGSETHAGEDVGIYAIGPGASLVTGTNEQSIIFHVMEYAADLIAKADSKLP